MGGNNDTCIGECVGYEGTTDVPWVKQTKVWKALRNGDMRQPTVMGSSITTGGGDAQVHGRRLPVAPIELAELLLGADEADLETFDLAEPAFCLGFGDSGDQVVADLGKPCPLGRVRSQERTSDASISELALVR
ncbi:hypothetical protein [Streptomyces sp. NPDC004232]|uniref:hypothetical protein n=1 Tax=unclassified Streptomyces TaxID=2593676 RepID=UPI0033A2464A